MATKPNRAGQQQPYVPAGNGDASGEYADSESGSNVHYSSPEREREKTPESVEKQPSKSVESETTSGDIDVNSLVGEGGEVKISRGSLTESQQKIFNDALDGFYKEFPDIPKFDTIKVDKKSTSATGGHIKWTYDYSKNPYAPEKKYELYINSGWISEKTMEQREQAHQFVLNYLKAELKNTTEEHPGLTSKIEELKQKIQGLEQDREYSNVAFKINDEHERLKNVINHELMHRELIYKLDGPMSEYSHVGKSQKQVELHYLILKTFQEAKISGDIGKISKYARVDADEFVSEAYSQVMSGIETPEYIKNMVKAIKEFKK